MVSISALQAVFSMNKNRSVMRFVTLTLKMCDEIVEYASACVLRNKMTCAMKLDYSEEEVRSVNLTHSSSPNCAQRQDTGQDVWS